MPKSLAEFNDMRYNKTEEYISLRKDFRKKLTTTDFKDMKYLKGELSDVDARIWYDSHNKNISNMIDKTKSIDEQARQAHSIRNKHRQQTRELMVNTKKRRELDRDFPMETYEETITRKMGEKNITREEAIIDIAKTSTKSNSNVNINLGLEYLND